MQPYPKYPAFRPRYHRWCKQTFRRSYSIKKCFMSNPDPLATVTPFIRIRFHEFGHDRGESYYQGSSRTSKTTVGCVHDLFFAVVFLDGHPPLSTKCIFVNLMPFFNCTNPFSSIHCTKYLQNIFKWVIFLCFKFV